MKINKQTLIFLVLFSLALLVRLWRIEYIPFQGDNDELAYVFAGMSFLQEGRPTSWSSFDYDYRADNIYGKVVVEDDSINQYDAYTFVSPWLDHPPLLPLLEGAWLKAWGYSFPQLYPSLLVRLPMLVLSGVTLWLVYEITKHFFGFTSGLASLILMGFSPLFIFAQRMAIGENLYVPLLLLTVYLAIKKVPLVWLVLVSALVGFAKVPGVLVVPVIGAYLAIKRDLRTAAVYASNSLVLFAGLYSLYGYWLDWTQFVQLFKTQSFRLFGWRTPTFLLATPGFLSEPFIPMMDASYYLILIFGLVPLLNPRSKNERWLLVAVFLGLVLVWMTSSEGDLIGWYKLPLFTFLTVSAGKFFTNKLGWGVLGLALLAVINNFGLVRFQEHPYPEPILLKLVVGVSFAGLLSLVVWTKQSRVIKPLLVGLTVIYVGISFYVVDHYYEAICGTKSCNLPKMTLVGLVKGGG